MVHSCNDIGDIGLLFVLVNGQAKKFDFSSLQTFYSLFFILLVLNSMAFRPYNLIYCCVHCIVHQNGWALRHCGLYQYIDLYCSKYCEFLVNDDTLLWKSQTHLYVCPFTDICRTSMRTFSSVYSIENAIFIVIIQLFTVKS